MKPSIDHRSASSMIPPIIVLASVLAAIFAVAVWLDKRDDRGPVHAYAFHVDDIAVTNTATVGGVITQAGNQVFSIAGTGLSSSGATVSANTSVLQSRVTGTCSDPFGVLSIASDGTVTCSTTTASMATGTNNQTLKRTGTRTIGDAWPSDDATTWGVASRFTITESNGNFRSFGTGTIDGLTSIGGSAAGTHTLEVLGTGQVVAAITDAGNAGGEVFIAANQDTSNAGGVLSLGFKNDGNTYTRSAALKLLETSGAGSGVGDLAFLTRNATGDTALTERMRIAAGGGVTIQQTLGVTDLATLTGGFSAGANSSVTGTLTVTTAVDAGGSPYTPSGVTTGAFVGTGSSVAYTAARANSGSTGGPTFLFFRTRGADVATRGTVANSDQLGRLQFDGDDGTGTQLTAQIAAVVNGTVATNQVPTDIVFYTSATNTSAIAEAFRLKSDQSALFGGQLDFGSHKGVNVTNGSNPQDAVAFNQLATAVNAAVSGTTNQVSKFTGANTIGNSNIADNGTTITLNATAAAYNNIIDFLPTTNATGAGALNYNGYNGGAAQFRDLGIYNGKNAQVAYFTGSSKAVEFNGAGTFDTTLHIVGALTEDSNIVATTLPATQTVASGVNVANQNTAQTATGETIYAHSNGSFNTTSGALINYIVYAEAHATRIAGANALTNIALLADATSGQSNVAIYAASGDVDLNQVAGITNVLGHGSTTGDLRAADATAVSGTGVANQVLAVSRTGSSARSTTTAATLNDAINVAVSGAPTGSCVGHESNCGVLNRAIYATASGGDTAYSGYFDTGDFYVHGDTSFDAANFTVSGANETFGSTTNNTTFTVNSNGAAYTMNQTSFTITGATESFGGALNMNSHLINNVTDPASAQDAATKNYDDTHVGSYTQILKGADQDVTNSATLADDSALQFSVTAGKIYAIDALIVVGGSDTTGDYKSAWTVAAGTMDCSGTVQSLTTADAIQDTTVIATAAASTNSTAIGTRADASLPIGTRWTLGCKVSNTTTLKYQFAENSAVSAKVARTMAGSWIRWKQLN